jgi:holo-[acyl-carrier protein] synthase
MPNTIDRMSLCIGIDLTDVEEVRESVRVHGSRYLERVYTDSERRDCAGSARRLAASFAAKEATMKALGSEHQLPWRSIAVQRDRFGRATLQLTGPAAELARARGVSQLDVSFTQASSHAAAVVLGRAA